jgi:hypothetical protein
MEFLKNNRGNILLTALAVVLGIILGLSVFGSWYNAEAVLGGSGNVTQSNNPHNFAAGSTGVAATAEDRVCVFCHTPHHALMSNSLINGPLWNHKLSSATYNSWSPGISNSPYNVDAGYVNVLTTQPSQPDGTSRMCMGCHDGTIGIGDIVSGAAIIMDTSHACIDADGSLSISCTNLTITDLTTKHIVSIPMNDQLIANSAAACDGSQTTKLSYPWLGGVNSRADTVFLRPTTTTYLGAPGISSGFPNNKYKAGYSYGVQCSTCHDPHDWSANPGTEGYKFLVTANQSELCKACHDPCS